MNFPRIAITGFHANYAISPDAISSRAIGEFQHFCAAGETTLRSAFAEKTSCQNTEFAAQTRSSDLSFARQSEQIIAELRGAKLWDDSAQNAKLAIDAARVGVVFSASKNDFAAHRVLDFASDFSDSSGNFIAQKIGARGPRLSPVAACATGSHAMILGAQLIQDNYADVAICGAIEPNLTPLVLAAYENMGALSKSGVMRPFDKKRDGFVPNVGAGFLILENAESAEKRGAQIHGFLGGWAMNCDATHMTAMNPSGDSIARAIEYSMRRADVSAIDYVNAHGTATKLNDEVEARGIALAIGNHVAVSSTKPLTGHLLGAAGAVEAAISLLALRENYAPPTQNLHESDDEISLDLVRGAGRNLEINSVLSLSYGFGGHIGALLFTKN